MHARGTSTVLPFFLRLLTDRTSQCRIEILCNLSASEPVDHRASPVFFGSRDCCFLVPFHDARRRFFGILLLLSTPDSSLQAYVSLPVLFSEICCPRSISLFPLSFGSISSGLFRCLSLLRCSWDLLARIMPFRLSFPALCVPSSQSLLSKLSLSSSRASYRHLRL